MSSKSSFGRLALPGAVLALALGWPCATPLAAAVATVTNTATVTASNNDPAASNNTATVSNAVVPSIIAVPTVSGYGLATLAVLLGAGAFVVSRRRATRS